VRILVRAMLVGVLGLAGCSSSTTAGPGPSASPAVSGASQFGGTDRAWIELNIAMDEELLPLLALAPQRGGPGVRAVAAEVTAVINAELGTLRELRDQAGLPTTNPHKGMSMPGMVTPEQVSKAAALTGKSFDALVVEAVKAHLTQGETLAKSETKSGADPRTRALAAEILRSRQATRSKITNMS